MNIKTEYKYIPTVRTPDFLKTLCVTRATLAAPEILAPSWVCRILQDRP